MRDDDVGIVLHLIEKSNPSEAIPFLRSLAKSGSGPFKILIACVLSLRTRDSTTKAASNRLFFLAADPYGMANLSVKQIENAIYPVGFYRTKAKQIQEISQKVCREFQGKVPSILEDLMRLPGVGRKTANLVRTMGYRKLGICVDIHVHRICNRLGYVKTQRPNDTEEILRRKLPKKYWIGLNNLLVSFGQINVLLYRLGVVPAP